MTKIEAWEVWCADVLFENATESKCRPVVITSSGTMFVIAIKVTTHEPRDEWGEYALIEWERAGLKKPSTVRIGKSLRLHHDDLKFRIGKLHALDILNIQQIISGKK